MPSKVEIIGVDEFNKFLKEELKHDKARLNKTIVDAATMTHRTAIGSIQTGGRSGRIYKRRSVTHQASAPGEKPKTDTGDLVRNITMEKIASGFTVGSRKGAPHGFWLEFGTSKMDARPWLQPAFDNTVRKIGEALNRDR